MPCSSSTNGSSNIKSHSPLLTDYDILPRPPLPAYKAHSPERREKSWFHSRAINAESFCPHCASLSITLDVSGSPASHCAVPSALNLRASLTPAQPTPIHPSKGQAQPLQFLPKISLNNKEPQSLHIMCRKKKNGVCSKSVSWWLPDRRGLGGAG